MMKFILNFSKTEKLKTYNIIKKRMNLVFIKERIERIKTKYTYKRFNKKFGIPCIVHATTPRNIKLILKDGVLKKTSKRRKVCDLPRCNPFEKLINLHDCVWFAVGFQYNIKNEPYGFIFEIDEIDDKFEVFHYNILSQVNKIIIRYWRDNDKEYLKELMNESPKTRRIITYFLATEKTGWGSLRFWEISNTIFSFFENYPKKKELINKILRERKKNKIKSSIKKYLYNEFKKSRIETAEIVSYRNIKLDNPNLIGLFVKDREHFNRVKKELLTFIKKAKNIDENKFLIFDGKRKFTIDEMLSNRKAKK